MRSIRTIACPLVLVLAGCTATDNTVLFVTKSSLGIDFDGNPASASIAYDRKEGYLGPRYDNGAAPPVVAKISTNGNAIFNREVQQFYATGPAAQILAGDSKAESPKDLVGKTKPMFFGTETTLGIKIGFTANVPDSLIFGFRRKEYSLIPLGIEAKKPEDEAKHFYPSVLGMFGTDLSAGTPDTTKFKLAQFFATGVAAEGLARSSAMQGAFNSMAEEAAAELKDALRQQQAESLTIIRCFARVRDDSVARVYTNADALKLYSGDTNPYAKLAKRADTQATRAEYVTAISVVPAAAEMGGKLFAHRVYVCSPDVPKI